ncbi:MAG: hypothetical protein ACTH2Q_00870 [Propionibacteriaceae bacterium]
MTVTATPGLGRIVGRLTIGLLVVLLGSAWALAATPAQAQDPESSVTIRMTSLAPAVPAADDTIVIQGTVTNTTDTVLTEKQALLWRSPDPIVTREAMTAALESDADNPLCCRRTTEGAFQDLPEIPPGESVPFEVRSTLSDLEVPTTNGVLLVGVHVVGLDSRAIGRARTFLPVRAEGAAPEETQQVTSVVLLSSPPAVFTPALGSDEPVFRDDHLAEEVAAGGRLDRLLESAARADVSFAVDPALVDELTTMSGGYRVGNAGGDTVEGTGAEAAAAWLGRFGELTASGDGHRVPFAAPDLAALAHHGENGARVLERGVAAAQTVPATRNLPLLALPAGGLADQETVATAATLDPTAVLLSDTSTGADQTLLAGDEHTGEAGFPVVNFTAGGFDGGPGPAPDTTTVQQRQRLLADSLISVLTVRGAATVRLITSPAQAAADAAADAPWTERRSLTELLATTPTDWPGQLTYPPSAADQELTAAQLDSVDALADGYANYQRLLDQPELVEEGANAALPRAASQWWRGAEEPSRAYVDPQLEQLGSVFDGSGVELQASRRVYMTGSEGNVSINVTNNLAQDVRVRLDFASSNTRRLSIPPEDDLLIPAGSTVNTLVQPQAVSNGPVTVEAQLTTVCETDSECVPADVGRSVSIEVVATRYGTVGWLIAVGAGIVLVGATVFRIRQVRRERTASTDSSDGTDEGTNTDASGTTTEPGADTDQEARLDD